MSVKHRLIVGASLVLILIAGCGQSRDEAASDLHSGARAFGPIQWAHGDLEKQLKAIFDGHPADAAALDKGIQDLEKAVAERRERLKHLDRGPQGESVKPLLESCERHMQAQEQVWLPEMKKVHAMLEKGETGLVLKLSVRGAMGKCADAEEAAMKDLREKFAAYEKEFQAELKRKGRI
jgi:hypothetical protein